MANFARQFAEALPKEAKALVPGGLLPELAYWTGLFHDIGKTTSFFQAYIRAKKPLKSERSRHSLLSALTAFWALNDWCARQPVCQDKAELLAFVAFMVIRYHHGNLTSPMKAAVLGPNVCELVQEQWRSIEKESLQAFWEAFGLPLSPNAIGEKFLQLPRSFRPKRMLIHQLGKRQDFDLYFLTNTLYSILLDADKSAAGLAEWSEDLPSLKPDWVDRFRKLSGWDSPKTEFDRKRQAAYVEAVTSVQKENESRIFSLQIPTGFGKTFTAFSAALKILHRRGLERIVYALPFTSIIDQNFQEMTELLRRVSDVPVDSRLILKHHYLGDVFYVGGGEYDTLESQLLLEGWASRIVVTTFVQFFHTLVGYRNRMVRKFHRLANSVIILDEIQAIPFKYWKLLNTILQAFVRTFNSTVLLVTATEPRLFGPDEKSDLVDATPYFQSVNRVILRPDFTPVHNVEELCDWVLEKSVGKKRVIVALNTVGSAREFYERVASKVDNPSFLSSHVVPKQRLALLNELRNSDRYFLVTTQIIEAGVNLDAQILFRDIGPLDSINQVAGRCNRFANEKSGEVFVFKLLDNRTGRVVASYVYDIALLELTQKALSKPEIQEQEFLRLCDVYFKQMAALPQGESEELLESVANLRYSDGENTIEQFHLIEQGYAKADVFVEVDEQAKAVWRKFLELAEISDVWERRKVYLSMKNRFQNFVISVGVKDLKKNPPPLLGGMAMVPYEQLNEYYDPITGFKTAAEAAIW